MVEFIIRAFEMADWEDVATLLFLCLGSSNPMSTLEIVSEY